MWPRTPPECPDPTDPFVLAVTEGAAALAARERKVPPVPPTPHPGWTPNATPREGTASDPLHCTHGKLKFDHVIRGSSIAPGTAHFTCPTCQTGFTFPLAMLETAARQAANTRRIRQRNKARKAEQAALYLDPTLRALVPKVIAEERGRPTYPTLEATPFHRLLADAQQQLGTLMNDLNTGRPGMEAVETMVAQAIHPLYKVARKYREWWQKTGGR